MPNEIKVKNAPVVADEDSLDENDENDSEYEEDDESDSDGGKNKI